MRPSLIISTLSALLLTAAVANAQQTNRFAVTESYDAASPEVPGVSAADVFVVNTTMIGGGGVQWSAAAMGLPAGANVDAFSDGTDVLSPVPPISCRNTWVEYTVDRATVGAAIGPISGAAAGNGAASDTFAVLFSIGGSSVTYNPSNALGVTTKWAGPVETDLDALAWAERGRWPVYFSLDAPSAQSLGVSPADVLTSNGTGTWTVFRTATSLGLSATDDVDALAVDAAGGVVLSVSRTSPTNVSGPHAGAAAAGLLRSAGGVLSTYVLPAKLWLQGTDDLNGARITDIGSLAALNSSQNATYEMLRIDGTGGNVRHVVEIPVGQPFQFDVAPQSTNPYIVFYSLGQPCLCNALPTNNVAVLAIGGYFPGCPGGPPLFGTLFIGAGPVQLTTQLNFPVEVTMQAVQGAAWVEGSSNAVTLRID